MATELDEFLTVHTVTVETYLGEKTTGPVYASPVSVSGWLNSATELARTGDSDEASSLSTMFYTDTANTALFTVKSRITSPDLGGDGKATVIKANSNTSGALGLPDHLAVALL